MIQQTVQDIISYHAKLVRRTLVMNPQLVVSVVLAAICIVPLISAQTMANGNVVASKDNRALAKIVATMHRFTSSPPLVRQLVFDLKEVEWSQVDGRKKSITLKDDSMIVTITSQASSDGEQIYLKDYRVEFTDTKETCSGHLYDYHYPAGKHPMLHAPDGYRLSFGCTGSWFRMLGAFSINHLEFEIGGDEAKIREGQFSTEAEKVN